MRTHQDILDDLAELLRIHEERRKLFEAEMQHRRERCITELMRECGQIGHAMKQTAPLVRTCVICGCVDLLTPEPAEAGQGA